MREPVIAIAPTPTPAHANVPVIPVSERTWECKPKKCIKIWIHDKESEVVEDPRPRVKNPAASF